tara:strand:- start:1201 stop:1458 length:258 start_codon:yes stop_codon:yes gene_type:complete
MKNRKLFGYSLVGVVINLILPFLAKPFATKEQIKPPKGAHNLPFLGQIIHMLVHHAQVPLSSSIIIAAIVGLSVYIGSMLEKKNI